jgi:glycosyltransferase involved in cell wall biosynthesis
VFSKLSFVDTGSVDGTRQRIQKWADFHKENVVITDFEWCDDFAAARNAAHAQLDTTWQMWLDTDDKVDDLIGVHNLIAKLEKNYERIDCVQFLYDYSIDEALRTPRLFRGNWYWKYAIHEQLVPVDPKTELGMSRFAYSTDIKVTHMRRGRHSSRANLKRNHDVAIKHFDNVADPVYKAHLAQAMAMYYAHMDEMHPEDRSYREKAIPLFEYIYEVNSHHPYGRAAAASRSQIYALDNDLDNALVWAKRAGKSFEAIVHYNRGEYQECINKQSVGFFEPIQTTHLAERPQYASAQFLLAEAGKRLGYSQQAYEAAVNLIPKNWRRGAIVPEIVHFRQNVDKISILVPGTPQPFDETSTDRMLGGSEEAVVYLARELVKQGRNVTVYGCLPPLRLPGVGKDGVDYQHFKSLDLDSELGTVVVWRCLSTLERVHKHYTENPDCEGIYNTSFWAHDFQLSPNKTTNQRLLEACSSVVVLSQYHLNSFKQQVTNPDGIRFTVLSNGVVEDDMMNHWVTPRIPGKAVYTSCPTRGLSVLLDMWPRVKAAVPKATLDIYYDWSALQASNPPLYKDMLEKLKNCEHLGVTHKGGVGHNELYEAIATAAVWAYSHFTNVKAETFCISAVKAQALGTQVLTVPNGALAEVVPEAHLCDNTDDYEQALIEYLADKTPQPQTADAVKALERFSWSNVAARFSEIWSIKQAMILVDERDQIPSQ